MLMTSLPCLLRHLFLNFVFIFSYETARLPRQSSGKDRHSVETSISSFFFLFLSNYFHQMAGRRIPNQIEYLGILTASYFSLEET